MSLRAMLIPEQKLAEENANLRARLAEAEEVLRAIRSGEVDALVVEGSAGPQIYTLQGLDAEEARVRGDMLAQVSDAVIAVDNEECVIFLNAAAERQYGVTASEVLGRRQSEIYECHWPTEDEAAARTALREHGEWRGENIHITRDGRRLYVESSVALLRRPDGALTGMVAAIRNITKRKEAEVALGQNMALFSKIIEQAPGGVYVVDAQFRVAHVNAEALPIFASAQPLIGRDFDEVLEILWGPEIGPQCANIFRHTLATGKRYVSPRFSEQRHDIGVQQAFEWETQRITLPDRQHGVVCYFHDVTARERAEAALRLLNERFDLAVKCSRAVLWQQDLQLRFTWLHNPAPGIVGSDAVGKRDEDLLERAEDAAVIVGLKREVIRSGVSLRKEFFPQIQGVVHCFEVLMEPLRDAAGLITGITGVAIDITELKRAEEARHESERQYRALIEASSEVAYRMSADWSTLLALEGRQLVASSKQPLANWAWLDQNIPRDEHPRVRQAISEAIARKTLFELQHRILRPDGSTGWTLSRAIPILDKNREVISWFGAASDITERKAAEEALEKSEERWRHALEVSELGAWELNLANNTAWRSLKHDQLFGYEALLPRWTHELFLEHVLEADRVDVDQKFHCSVAEKKDWNFECRIRRVDGAERWIWAYGKMLTNAEGIPDRMFGLIKDITERKHEILRFADEDRRKSEFMAILAHELRNPLTPIKVAAQALRMAKIDDPTVARVQEIIERQANHMSRLVDDLLDIARLQSGKVKLKSEALNLGQAVSDATESCAHIIKSHNHQIKLNVQTPLWVEGDSARIVQIIENIIFNAAKYTPNHGVIQVTTGAEDGMAVVRVRDNGIGIAPEMLSLIFQVYTQVEQSLDRSQGGLGLGLKLVKELVSLHGGSVEAYSEGLNQGSEFVVRLPLIRAPVFRSDIPARQGVEPSVSRKILLIDDNADILESMQMMLTMCGHSVELAETGEQCVEKALQGRFDVALLDIGLPGMNGYEAAKKIRQSAACSGMVLIALSGYGQENDKRLAREAGFDAHLTKPADALVLSNLLKDLEKVKRDSAAVLTASARVGSTHERGKVARPN